MDKKLVKIYRHIYDKDTNEDGTKKSNELLGEFEIIEGSVNDDYNFEGIGINQKNGKKYKIHGQEISALGDRYNAGTKCFVEESLNN